MSQENNTTSDELVDHTFNGKQLKVYPEVAEFFRVKADAERQLQLGYAKADAAYNAEKSTKYIAYLEDGGDPHGFDARVVMGDLYTAWRDARRAAESRYYDLIEVGRMNPSRRDNRDNPNAWADLRDKTSHKEVKWIMEHTVNSQPHESEIMLHYLPASSDELWEYAKTDHGFCRVFDQFMTQAEAQGLFSNFTSAVGMKEFRALQSYLRRELYQGTATEITRKVASIMKVVREDGEKRLAEAKAEWQGLDEAWRSERSRRAAATRAANREAEADEHTREDGITETRTPLERLAEAREPQEVQDALHDVLTRQTPEPQPESPKTSTHDDFVLVNSN